MATKYRNVIRSVLNAHWAILPEKLAAICDVLNLRASGQKFSKSEIAARIGTQPPGREPMAQSGSVAVLNIFGVIANHMGAMSDVSGGCSSDAVSQAFDKYLNDPNCSAIVLNIDSPGGTVAGTQELAAKIYAARNVKPVIAVANGHAASAAYWIGSAAKTFVASPSSFVGSIGTLCVRVDDSKAQEKLGIKEEVISAGKFKAEGYGPMTEAERTYKQGIVDEHYEVFVAEVAKHRGTTAANVKQSYGQGRVLSAASALAAGMVDRVATLDQVLSELGVGAGAARGNTGAPAFSMEGLSMNPELFGALVRVGMCPITATQADAENAVLRFYAATSRHKPADEKAVIADLQSYANDPAKFTVKADSRIPATVPAAATTANADRAADILAAVKLASLPDAMEVASKLINNKSLDLSAALKEIDRLAAEHRKPAGATVTGGDAERDKFVAEARNAIFARTFGNSKPEQVFDRQSGDYVAYKPTRPSMMLQSLPRLAEECLVRDGYAINAIRNLPPDLVAQIALGVTRADSHGLRAEGGPYHTTGSFTNILLDAANVTLRRSYDEAQTTFQAWAKQADAIRDFKTVNRVIAGEIGDPRVVPEGDEFDEATMTDGKESYSLRVWGQIFSISWQAVVNDQLSAFTEIPRKQGVAMRRKQNRLVYGVLKDNPTMADTGALFNATAVTTAGGHANLTTGSATPTVSTLNAMTTKMMEQKGLNATSGAALNLMPKFIIGPPALRGTILELLGSTSYNASNNNSGVRNIWQNALEPVIDAEMGVSQGGSDTAWVLSVDQSSAVDTVEYAYLQGLESPRLDSEASFDRLALKYRMYLAFAVKAIDWRGLQKHAGA